MYDFYFGTKEEIEQDPKKYLLTIKRMLPRWCNSIPDSEYLAFYDIISGIELPENPIFIETGSGASTIVLCYFAVKKNGELFTWDINGSKLFYLRSVLNDTIMKHFNNNNLNNHWRYIAGSSISDFTGIGMLSELGKKVDVSFFDSEHTLTILKRELELTSKVLNDIAIVALDDANYSYIFHNTAYINMIRKKVGLTAINEASGNMGRHFWEEVGDFLRDNFNKVEYLDDSYKKNYRSDIFWSYFKNDRETMSNLKMERTDDLEHRFDAWKVWR